jgi:hypothetical protein
MKGVTDEDDAGVEGNPLTGQAVGVAATIPWLVTRSHHRQDRLQEGDRGQDPLADLGMAFHLVPLFGRELARLADDLAANADLPDVVEERREFQADPVSRREAGRRSLPLERRERLGGAARSANPH